MCHYVYMLISAHKEKYVSYVGYSKDPKKRLIKHNSGLGENLQEVDSGILFTKKN